MGSRRLTAPDDLGKFSEEFFLGGYGSGRHWFTKKDTVEDCLLLKIDKLVRDRLLDAGLHNYGALTWTKTTTGEKVSSCGYEVNTLDLSASWLRLFYKLTRTGEDVDYTIRLVTTCPHFGGFRWWFRCPLVLNGQPCQRRVGKLYLPPGGQYYGCRVCYNLTYESCQESHKFDRAFAELAKAIPGARPQIVKRALSGGW